MTANLQARKADVASLAREILLEMTQDQAPLEEREISDIVEQVSQQLPELLMTIHRETEDDSELRFFLSSRVSNVLRARRMSPAETERLRKRLIHKSFQHVRDWNMAEDLVQETFVFATQKLHTFRGDSHISTWMHSILFSRIVSPSRQREVLLETLTTTAAMDDVTDPNAFLHYLQFHNSQGQSSEEEILEARDKLGKVLALLPVVLKGRYACRAINLMFLQQLKPQVAADIMEIKVEHLYKILSTARRDMMASRRIRAILENE